MRARQREWGVVVIEGRIRPGRRVMAHLASRREARVRHRTSSLRCSLSGGT